MSYRYFLLGDVVPVCVTYDAQGRKVSAEVPDRETGQLLQRATYMGRIDHSFEVKEITPERFHTLVEDIANKGSRLRKAKTLIPHMRLTRSRFFGRRPVAASRERRIEAYTRVYVILSFLSGVGLALSRPDPLIWLWHAVLPILTLFVVMIATRRNAGGTRWVADALLVVPLARFASILSFQGLEGFDIALLMAVPAVFSSIAAVQLSQPMAKQICQVLRRITDRQWHLLRQAERQRTLFVDISMAQITLQETPHGLCRTSLKADSETICLSMDYIGPAWDDPQGYALEVPRTDQARLIYGLQSITGDWSVPGVEIDAALIAACRAFFDQSALGFGTLERLAPIYGFSAQTKVKWHWRAKGMMASM